MLGILTVGLLLVGLTSICKINSNKAKINALEYFCWVPLIKNIYKVALSPA